MEDRCKVRNNKDKLKPINKTETYEYELPATHEDTLDRYQFSPPQWQIACPTGKPDILNHRDEHTWLSNRKLKKDLRVSRGVTGLGVAPHQGGEPAGEHQHEWAAEAVAPNIWKGYFFTSPFQSLHENMTGVHLNQKYSGKGTPRNTSSQVSLTHYKTTPIHSLATCHPYIFLQTIPNAQIEIIAKLHFH